MCKTSVPVHLGNLRQGHTDMTRDVDHYSVLDNNFWVNK